MIAAILSITAAAAKGIEFDLTINLGNILTVFAFLGGGIWFILLMQRSVEGQRHDLEHFREKLENLEQDITQMTAETQNDVKNLGQVIVLQSRHDERITALQLTVVNQGKRLDHAIERMNTYLDARGAKASDE